MTTLKDAQDVWDLAIARTKDHLQPDGGEPIVNKDGEIVGHKLNPQVLRFALAVAERENIRVRVAPGTPAAEMLKSAEDAIEGVEFDFPDEPNC